MIADNAATTVIDLSGGFRARGTVRLRGARVSDLLTFDGATLDTTGTALFGVGMQVGTFDFGLAAKPAGTVDLQGATVTALHDRTGAGPTRCGWTASSTARSTPRRHPGGRT